MKKIIFIFLVLLVIFPLSIQKKEEVTTKRSWVEKPLYDTNIKVPPQDINEDIIGKITITNTKINYDIVKTTNNEYYLNHDSNKKESKEGAIFMDYRNKPKDQKLLIYGHNSKDSTAPFKELENYLNKDFYTSNPNISIDLNNESYIYQIFSVMIVPPGDYRHTKIKFTKEEYQSHLSWLKTSSLYNTGIDVSNTDNILTLQTCYYQPKNSYLLINAKRRTK